MRTSLAIAICSGLIALLALSNPLAAQEKTVRACQDEWRANRAANQAAGITEPAYIDKCRAGAPIPPPAAAAPASSKPAAEAAPPAKPAAAPAARPVTTGLAPAAAAGQFSTEVQAKARCLSDTVVWANLGSKIYHFSGNRDYGNTKEGAYMCEKDAAAHGIRAAKNEKHP